MRLYKLLKSIPIVSKFANNEIIRRRNDILNKIVPLLSKESQILDIGSGTGHTAHELISEGYKVMCVDLVNQNVFVDTKPTIYDGKKLPYDDKSFDTAILITVLHHTPNPEKILLEAARVSKKMIVMEDTYNSYFQKILTFWMDSVGNLEFFGHPHTNKTDTEWKKLFKKLGFEMLEKQQKKFMLFFESTTYHLKTTKTND